MTPNWICMSGAGFVCPATCSVYASHANVSQDGSRWWLVIVCRRGRRRCGSGNGSRDGMARVMCHYSVVARVFFRAAGRIVGALTDFGGVPTGVRDYQESENNRSHSHGRRQAQFAVAAAQCRQGVGSGQPGRRPCTAQKGC